VPAFPLVGSAPFQPPLAAHDVAFVEVHVNIEAAPLAMAAGDASNATVGTTLTTRVAITLVPPGPVQLSE
jgi:hypothetical protein